MISECLKLARLPWPLRHQWCQLCSIQNCYLVRLSITVIKNDCGIAVMPRDFSRDQGPLVQGTLQTHGKRQSLPQRSCSLNRERVGGEGVLLALSMGPCPPDHTISHGIFHDTPDAGNAFPERQGKSSPLHFSPDPLRLKLLQETRHGPMARLRGNGGSHIIASIGYLPLPSSLYVAHLLRIHLCFELDCNSQLKPMCGH